MNTPRTDYEEKLWIGQDGGFDRITQLARELECENNQLREIIKNAGEAVERRPGTCFFCSKPMNAHEVDCPQRNSGKDRDQTGPAIALLRAKKFMHEYGFAPGEYVVSLSLAESVVTSLKARLESATRRADARAREACTFEGRTGCSFRRKGDSNNGD